MAEDRVELAIIGGGIVGCAAAAFAAERGAAVALFERTAIGAGASGRNLGAVQHPFDPVLVPLYEETIVIYRELAAHDAGFPFPPDAAGLLMIADDPEVARAMFDDVSSTAELHATLLEPRQLRSLEPGLAAGLWGVLAATGFPVPPDAATRAMADRAQRAGARFEIGRAAVPWVEHGSTRGVVLEGGRPIAADAVLIAAGPWSPYLVDPTGAWRPIVATWGATAQLEMASPPRHVIEEARVESVNRPVAPVGDSAMAPEATPSLFTVASAGDRVTLGSTFLGTEPDHRAMAPILVRRGSRFLPALAEARIVTTRACARPQSLDGRPLVGAVPGAAGLFIAAGHGPWGISTGPATARMVVDVVLGGRRDMPAELDIGRTAPPTVHELHLTGRAQRR